MHYLLTIYYRLIPFINPMMPTVSIFQAISFHLNDLFLTNKWHVDTVTSGSIERPGGIESAIGMIVYLNLHLNRRPC